MTTFVVICGTSGSGKTYVTQRLIDEHQFMPISSNRMSPPLTGREVPYAHVRNNVCVAGRYNTGLEHGSSGDAKNQFFAGLLKRCAERADIVVTQGLTIGKSNVLWELVKQRVPDTHVIFAYLDTPLERCIENVYERRRRCKRPRTTPLKENAIKQDWRTNKNQRVRFMLSRKEVRDIRHGPYALNDLVQLIRVEGGDI